jgi:hypothetical protein
MIYKSKKSSIFPLNETYHTPILKNIKVGFYINHPFPFLYDLVELWLLEALSWLLLRHSK